MHPWASEVVFSWVPPNILLLTWPCYLKIYNNSPVWKIGSRFEIQNKALKDTTHSSSRTCTNRNRRELAVICKECHNYPIELSFYKKKKKKNNEKVNHLGSNISCLCLRLPNNDLNKTDWSAKVQQTQTNNNTKHIMINTHFPSLQVWRINFSKQNEIKQNPCNPKTPCPSPESRVNKCFW